MRRQRASIAALMAAERSSRSAERARSRTNDVAADSGRSYDRVLRYGLGAIGVVAIGYGALRILQDHKHTHPFSLAEWLIGALIVHDGIIAPITVAIGLILSKLVPARARSYVQAGLVVAGLISAVGVLLIWRAGKNGSAPLTLLQQNYRANLIILLLIVAVATVLAYAVALLRSKRTKSRPPADH